MEIGKTISENAIILVIIRGSSDQWTEHTSALPPSQNAVSDDIEEFNKRNIDEPTTLKITYAGVIKRHFN